MPSVENSKPSFVSSRFFFFFLFFPPRIPFPLLARTAIIFPVMRGFNVLSSLAILSRQLLSLFLSFPFSPPSIIRHSEEIAREKFFFD